MIKIYVSKAEPITNKEPVNDAEIHIKKSIPEFQDLKQLEEYFKNDAHDIYDILKNNLPQGTRYQLLLCMLNDAKILYCGK